MVTRPRSQQALRLLQRRWWSIKLCQQLGQIAVVIWRALSDSQHAHFRPFFVHNVDNPPAVQPETPYFQGYFFRCPQLAAVVGTRFVAKALHSLVNSLAHMAGQSPDLALASSSIQS
jgi:hypothetical protein